MRIARLLLQLSLFICPLLYAPEAAITNQEQAVLPRSVIFGDPELMRLRLSPKGTYFSYVKPVNGVANVFIKERSSGVERQLTFDTERGIYGSWWHFNEKGLFFAEDNKGDENWHIYYVDLNTGTKRDLTPDAHCKVRLVQYTKQQPHILFIVTNERNPEIFDLYKLDLQHGTRELIFKNPGNAEHYLLKKDNTVGAYITRENDGCRAIWLVEDDNSLTELVRYDLIDTMLSGPIKFTEDGSALMLIESYGVDKARLVKFDIATRRRSILFEHSDYDVEGVEFEENSDEIVIVGTSADKNSCYVYDPERMADYNFLQGVEKGKVNVVSRTLDDSEWLVVFVPEDGAPKYYLYDRANQSARYLFTLRPELDDYPLNEKECIKFTARDGLTIHGYLTYPTTTQEKTNLPLVLRVHGGPWTRDEKDFDSEVHWLASRGYAVLQVNYRGSLGYGKSFIYASAKEWGGKMQDDLTDAVQWAINQGIADSTRVAIMGGSYGGYAALAGATFTPDLYCCAVDMCGPSSLITLINSIPPYWRPQLSMFDFFVGNVVKDYELLKKRSPLFAVDNIRIPLLIVQGANDPRVTVREAEQMVQAMAAKGLPYEYLLFPDEGHSIHRLENRMKYLRVVEQFLAQHLGGIYVEAD